MAANNLRTLVNKLNAVCRRTLEAAAGLCLSRSNYHVELEHWLLKLVEDQNSDLAPIFKHYDIDANRVSRELNKSLDGMKTGNGRPPELSIEVLDLMKDAWNAASLDFGAARLRSGYLLVALLNDRQLALQLKSNLPELFKLPADRLANELPALLRNSAEEANESPAASSNGSANNDGPNPVNPGSKTPSLDQFTMNLTQRARDGKIDPVIGRDFEIRQVIDILTRRRQNNPILTGEAGVGKTAVVEGFALRIAAKDVPDSLKNVELHTLDLGLLQAGAGVKGEFENRLKSVMAEVKASPTPIILFIDEAHTLIGAGGGSGGGDAANLLKPALARGELRTVAATTWMEYKKYFETDAALKRRFQVVKVEEPEIGKAVQMVRGLVPTLERHHKIRILEEAVEDAVKLSYRYITDRQLPDKAISLLDTSCARVSLSQSSTPPAIEDAHRELEAIEAEITALTSESTVGVEHVERLAELASKETVAEEKIKSLEARWNVEKRLVKEIQTVCGELQEAVTSKTAVTAKATASAPVAELATVGAGSGSGDDFLLTEDESASFNPADDELSFATHADTGWGEPNVEQVLRDKLKRLDDELATVQGEFPLVQPVVDSQAVAAVVSGWTGIPVGKMVLDEVKTVLSLKEKLEQRIVGQSHALEAIAQRIQTSRAGLADPKRPIGVFMLVGPSGVGKTETAMALSDILYGGDRNMVVVNMSEYKEEHKISRLTGSAPGYVGYGEGGVLTEAVRRKPYSIVLLDEVEKAHPAVQEIFYQVFDKGMLQDDRGNEVNFKNTIILLTSNAGSDALMKVCADPDTMPDPAGLAETLRPELLKVFKPALLGRINIVPYYPLSDEVLRSIIRLQFTKIVDRVRENHRAEFSYDEAVVGAIASRCKEVESGARNADHIITGTLLPDLSREFLARLAAGETVERIHVGVDAAGKFTYEIA